MIKWAKAIWNKLFKRQDDQDDEQTVTVMAAVQPMPKDSTLIRAWWHTILRTHDRYSCFATLLVLPSDTQAIHYLSNNWKELDLISGDNCLVLVFSKNEFWCSSIDQGLCPIVIGEHVNQGSSIDIANLLGVGFDKFPCLVIFRDIRSPEHIMITFKGMTEQEINTSMRSLFSIIQEAAHNKRDPLAAIELHRKEERFHQKGLNIISNIQAVAGNVIETAVTAWIKTNIK
jgi:hypothetical protein